MYIYKLANAAASKITVTATATTLFDLLDTAAGTANGLPGYLNAVDLVVEDGDVRMLLDGNTPTGTNGILLSSGVMYSFRGIPLTQMRLVRVTGDVSVSVQVGKSEAGEGSSAAAFDVTLEAGTVTIGGVDITEIAGTAVNVNGGNRDAGTMTVTLADDDPATVSLGLLDNVVFADEDAYTFGTSGVGAFGGVYSAAGDEVADGQIGALAMSIARHLLVQSDSYDSGTTADKSYEVSPLSAHHVEEKTTITNATSAVAQYVYLDMDGYRDFGIQFIKTGGVDTVTFTVEATLQDDGTAAASCFYEDVTSDWFGVANWTTGDYIMSQGGVVAKYVRLKVLTAGGNNDADFTILTKKLY